MDIIKNQKGQERAMVQVDYKRIRVMGDSHNTRLIKDSNGNIDVLEFQNGPRYSVNSSFRCNKIEWKIDSIDLLLTEFPNFTEAMLHVTPIYTPPPM